MEVFRSAKQAMGTRFELVLTGDDPVRLRAAAEEGFAEIERLEQMFNFYSPASELSYVNSLAATKPVKVSADFFFLVAESKRLHQQTGGLFDPTIGPLVRLWGLHEGARSKGNIPSAEELEAVRQRVGMQMVALEQEAQTVSFSTLGMQLDFGSIAKGFAIDRAKEFLLENRIDHGFLHGGTSTIVAWGSGPGEKPWKVALEDPRQPAEQNSLLGEVLLNRLSLSVSSIYGKYFSAGSRIYGHVLDPRNGAPHQGNLLAAVQSPSALVSDALSTALLVGGAELLERSAELPSNCGFLLFQEVSQQAPPRVLERGWKWGLPDQNVR